MKIKGIDFCCGAGGLSRGLLNAGIEVLAGVDIDGRLQKTYETNNQPSKFLQADIQTLNVEKLRNDLNIDKTDVVVYAACTPCQPFSSLNRNAMTDDRKDLLLAFGRM